MERSLQTKNSITRNVEEQMEIKLQQLHIQRKMWRGHNIHAFCWSFLRAIANVFVKGGVHHHCNKWNCCVYDAALY